MTVERLAVFNMVSVGQAAEALAYYWHESRPVCRGRGRRAGAPRPASNASSQRAAPRLRVARHRVRRRVRRRVRPSGQCGRAQPQGGGQGPPPPALAAGRAASALASCFAGASGRTRPRAAAARRVAPRRALDQNLSRTNISLRVCAHR